MSKKKEKERFEKRLHLSNLRVTSFENAQQTLKTFEYTLNTYICRRQYHKSGIISKKMKYHL